MRGRYWDGAEWTPWVWYRDLLGVDFNGDPDVWLVTEAPTTSDLGCDGFVIKPRPRVWMAPPLYNAHLLLGKRRVDRIIFKHQALALLAMLVVSFITVVLFHPWADDPAPEHPSVQLADMLGPDTPQTAAATVPVGQWHRYDDGVSARVIEYVIAPSDASSPRSDLDVDLEVCVRKGTATVDGTITVVTSDGRHLGDTTTREPAFEGGVVRAGCRRGWITVAVPTDAQPTQFDWGGFGRGHARWLVG